MYVSGMLLKKKRTRSVRSLVGSPDTSTPTADLNVLDALDTEIEQPRKRVALQVSAFLF